MITELQKQFLLKHYGKPMTKKERKKYNVYMDRIQKQIDKKMDVTIWLAKFAPEILLNEYNNMNKHKRLQNLLLIIKILKPQLDVYLEIAKDAKIILD